MHKLNVKRNYYSKRVIEKNCIITVHRNHSSKETRLVAYTCRYCGGLLTVELQNFPYTCLLTSCELECEHKPESLLLVASKENNILIFSVICVNT